MSATGWLIECARCGHGYAVDRAAIMAGTWQVCPACQDAPDEARQADAENAAPRLVGHSGAPERHSRPDARLGAGMPEHPVSRVLSDPERPGDAS